jgi:beta-galactosidase
MDHLDVIGFNIYDGWYGGVFEDFGPSVDEIHRRYPDKAIIISEYGAGMERGRHTENPVRYDFSEEWGCIFHEKYLDTIDSRPFIAGSAIWNIFDFGVEGRLDQTIPHMNQKGIFDYYRVPKDVYYLYLSRWSDKPVAYIVSHTWTERFGDPGETKNIRVYTNCDEMEFFINGKSLGVQTSGFTWPVKFENGTNRLKAVGNKDGASVEDSMEVRY